MSRGLDLISELDDLFKLMIFVLQFFVGFLEIFDFFFTDEKFFLGVSEIGQ